MIFLTDFFSPMISLITFLTFFPCFSLLFNTVWSSSVFQTWTLILPFFKGFILMQMLARSVHVIMDENKIHFPVEEKGQHDFSLKGSKNLGPCCDQPSLGFSAHYMMVLIYYAQVCFRWLPFTENKGASAASHTTEGYLQMEREK
ncbi:hypothetical protein HJG60_011338 [Phyllostomus discolor]|uniref:Uncharacterized protein n=1 Tax=Phyllostomus discolor TaxID=89673 RepID=A0A834A2H0_9CHIR|nr:hypothetical protein HJG60_011338 [Phyllostomus discolor]